MIPLSTIACFHRIIFCFRPPSRKIVRLCFPPLCGPLLWLKKGHRNLVFHRPMIVLVGTIVGVHIVALVRFLPCLTVDSINADYHCLGHGGIEVRLPHDKLFMQSCDLVHPTPNIVATSQVGAFVGYCHMKKWAIINHLKPALDFSFTLSFAS